MVYEPTQPFSESLQLLWRMDARGDHIPELIALACEDIFAEFIVLQFTSCSLLESSVFVIPKSMIPEIHEITSWVGEPASNAGRTRAATSTRVYESNASPLAKEALERKRIKYRIEIRSGIMVTSSRAHKSLCVQKN